MTARTVPEHRSLIRHTLVKPTPTVIQTASNSTSAATSITATFGASVQPGSLVLVNAGQGTHSQTAATCSGGSLTWRRLHGFFSSVGPNDITVGFWAIAASAFTTVTVSWPSSNFTGIQALEIGSTSSTPRWYGAILCNQLTSPTIWLPNRALAFYHVYESAGGTALAAVSGWTTVSNGTGWTATYYKATTADGDVQITPPSNGGSDMVNTIFGLVAD